MIVWPPIRHMMHVCHGHFFIYTFPPLTSTRPESHMMHIKTHIKTHIDGWSMLNLLFIVYWLQAWKSYALRAGSMHILTQGRECVTIYSITRKMGAVCSPGGSVLTYQWDFTWPTYLLTSLKRRHLVKTGSSSLSTLQLGNRLVSCAAVWPPCRENIKLS